MFRWLFQKRLRNHEIEEEFEAHLALEAKLLEERGLNREQAQSRARRLFGNKSRLAEQTREVWVWLWLDRLAQDLRYAVRSLLRDRAFTPAAVLSIALGVGAGTPVYSIADAIFLRPLPYVHPEQLLWVAVRFPKMGIEFLGSPDYVGWRRENRTFENLAATQPTDETSLLNGENAAEVHVMRVSANFLRTLEVKPDSGRDFTPDEERLNGPKPILLTSHFRDEHFGAQSNVIGKILRLDGQVYTVIGILPRSFVFPTDAKVDLLTTLSISPSVTYRDRMVAFWHVYGRLKPGVSVPQAQADLEHLFDRSKANLSRLIPLKAELVCKPLQQHRVGNSGILLSILAGAVTCLLLIVCANVSSLVLARWSSRSGEFAIRAAIGAGRMRLARQLLTEAALLTLMGCLLGMLLIFGVFRGFVHYAGNELPRLNEVTFDGRVFAIGLLVCLVTTALFAGLPALHAGRFDIQRVLQRSGRFGLANGYDFAKRTLIATEAALCLILLFSAALLLQTLWHLRNDRLGFEPEHVLAVSIPFKGTKLEAGNRGLLVSDILDFVRHVPGVKYAAQSECTPLTGGPGTTTFSRSDRPRPKEFEPGQTVHACGAGADYSKAAGLRVLQGRFFSEDDSHHPDTLAVLNETAARRFFPREDALGKRILGTRDRPDSPVQRWKTIVGVVSDSKNAGLDSPPAPQVFVNAMSYPYATRVRLLLRCAGDPAPLEAILSSKLRLIDSGLTAEYEPVSKTISEMSGGARFNAILVGSFAGIAFLMALIGVYGVLAFTVNQRTQEIGIRLALGGGRERIFRLVLREGIGALLIGIAAGLAIVLGLGHYLKSVLYGVTATDPATLALVALALIATGTIAISIPARRASRVDPMIALRYQ